MSTLVDGTTFLVTDAAGDVRGGTTDDPDGLFHDDTRHLSRWSLTVDGHPLTPLATSVDGFRAATTRAVAGRHPHGADLVVTRRQLVVGGSGLRDEVELTNHGAARAVTVELAVAADFADIFEVRGVPGTARRVERAEDSSGLSLSYAARGFERTIHVRCDSPAPATVEGLRATLTLETGAAARIAFTATLGAATDEVPGYQRTVAADRAELARWSAAATLLTGDSDRAATVRRSLADLRALAFRPPLAPHAWPVPAAGVPWFLTLFGRDSLLTAYLALDALPELAAGALRALADTQGRDDDPAREEQPGKILHECRSGELARAGNVPFGRYYGTVDATPLFVVVLEAYVRRTGDTALAVELEPAARAALGWLDGPGDADGDGFVEYASRNPDGLVNQGWKDSPDAVVFADGRYASGPIAVCEAQGYAYDARRRGARLAREVWGDAGYAGALDRAADALRDRFDAAFWCPDRGCYAAALDGAKQRVDSRTSNVGHLLWSGLVPAERVGAVADTLLAPELFSGWGVRTLAADEVAYNPVSYHRGSVWPHDSTLVALGLAGAGRRDDAARVANAVLDAARHTEHRLPELIAGFARADTGAPVPYPTACRPQAWAAASPIALLALLRGDPAR